MTEIDKIKLECFNWMFENLVILDDMIMMVQSAKDSNFHGYVEKFKFLQEPEPEADDYIIESELSVRCKHALLRHGIRTFKQLSELTRLELRRTRNLGTKSVREIERVLINHGYELRED